MAHSTGLPLSSSVYPSQRGTRLDREPPITRVRQSLVVTDFVFGCSLPFLKVACTSMSSVNAALRTATEKLFPVSGGLSAQELFGSDIAKYPDELAVT